MTLGTNITRKKNRLGSSPLKIGSRKLIGDLGDRSTVGINWDGAGCITGTTRMDKDILRGAVGPVKYNGITDHGIRRPNTVIGK